MTAIVVIALKAVVQQCANKKDLRPSKPTEAFTFSVKAPQPTSTLLIQLNTRRFEKQICLKKPFSFCEVNNQQDKNNWSGYFVQNVCFFWFLKAVLVRFNLKSDLEAAITLNLFLVIFIVNIVSIFGIYTELPLGFQIWGGW